MRTRQAHQQRRWLAEQAARCMVEQAIDDPLHALRRVVAAQPRRADRRSWPDAAEILACRDAYQRLFGSPEHDLLLRDLHRVAIEAMQFLAPYRPRLVGALLEGSADAHSAVRLHLHADDPDAVVRQLSELRIHRRTSEARIHLDERRELRVPKLDVEVDGISFELWVLPRVCERQAPWDPAREAPMARMPLRELEKLAGTGAR